MLGQKKKKKKKKKNERERKNKKKSHGIQVNTMFTNSYSWS